MTAQEFNTLYNKYWWVMLDYAKKFLPHLNDFYAEEVVAKTFIKFWEINPHFDNEENAKMWLYVAVKRRCLDVIKVNNRHKETVPFTTVDNSDVQLTYQDLQSFHTSEIAFQVLEQAIEIIKTYTKKEKIIFDLHFIKNLSVADMSAILKTAPQTISNQLATLRKKLRKEIKKPLP